MDKAVGFKTRLIDVQKRCLVNSALQERHLALSYVWGKSTGELLTTKPKDYYTVKEA